MTRLHAGGKFSHKNYLFSGGLHGVGVSVVNALSRRVEVTIRRGGRIYLMAFENGETVEPLRVTGDVGKRNTGTSVRFWPDGQFFDSVQFSVPRLKHLLRAKAVLCPGLQVRLSDEASGEETLWHYQDGLAEYLRDAVGDVATLPEEVLRELDRITAEVLAEEAAADADFARILESQQRFRADYALWKSRAYLPRDF
jgi:topoisomerase-4 subunit B